MNVETKTLPLIENQEVSFNLGKYQLSHFMSKVNGFIIRYYQTFKYLMFTFSRDFLKRNNKEDH